jgi:hypothetical protein
MTAIKAVVDILMYHGSAAFDEDEDKGNDSDEDLFDDEEEQVRKKIRSICRNKGSRSRDLFNNILFSLRLIQ